ncbi:MAG: GNAT family N-acetyltransferase [Pararhodobacter sp.]|nr:GNAT family N-acetyltransferase [Pararhodobacter sp.]
MSMPTPIAPLPCPPRSTGRLDAALVHAGLRAAFDPVHQAWIDTKRPDDLHPGSDALAPDSNGRADALALAGLSLRCWAPHDLAVLKALLDDPAVWTHMPEAYPAPLDESTARLLISAAATLPRQATRAVLKGGLPVGQVRLEWGGIGQGTGSPRQAELSYWLGRAHWGQGLGSAMVAGATQRAFANVPGLIRLTAKVQPANAASARLLKKAGFDRCDAPAGTRFADWHWYALRRQHRLGAALA